MNYIAAVKVALDAAGFRPARPGSRSGRSTPPTTPASSSSPRRSVRSPWPDVRHPHFDLASDLESVDHLVPPPTARSGAARARRCCPRVTCRPEQHFIDGQFRAGSSGQFIDVVDPCNGSVFARVARGHGRRRRRRRSPPPGPPSRPGVRSRPRSGPRLLLAIADRIEENADLLVRLESANAGKPLTVSRDDVSSTVDTFRFMAGAARRITSQAAGGLHRGPPVGDPARAARSDRRGHPVELPAADGGLEAGADPGRRQHRGAEAVRADPADHAEVRRARRRPAARRGAQRRHRLRPEVGGRLSTHPDHRHDRADRLGGQRPRGRQGGAETR